MKKIIYIFGHAVFITSNLYSFYISKIKLYSFYSKYFPNNFNYQSSVYFGNLVHVIYSITKILFCRHHCTFVTIYIIVTSGSKDQRHNVVYHFIIQWHKTQLNLLLRTKDEYNSGDWRVTKFYYIFLVKR